MRAANKKKMVIKPFKVKPKLPENFEETSWQKLKLAVEAVATKQPVATSREELYRLVEDLCIHKMAARLYQRLHDECDRHINLKVQSLVDQTPSHSVFLGMVEQIWCDHSEQMLTIRSIFLYLDRSYVIQTPSVRSIWDNGLDLFRLHLRRRPEIEAKITSGLLATIENERNGETVNHTLLRTILRMLSALQVYDERFQTPFLRETEIYYAAEGARYLEQSDIPHFLQHVERRLQQASDMAVRYLDSSTRKPLVRAVEQHLLAPHTTAVLAKGFNLLMDGNRIQDLSRLYALFQRVGALEELKVGFSTYAKRVGHELVSDDKRDKEMIAELLVLKHRLNQIFQDAFRRHDAYKTALKYSFEDMMHTRGNRIAELMAKYIDGKLKTKGSMEEETEAALDSVMDLFRYLHAKDVFEAFYKKDLAKRLLLGKSSSFDLEKSMIAKLKSECGSNFTNKLEGMFKDIDLSNDLMSQYQQHRADNRVTGVGQHVDMTVQVLTTGYWPALPPLDMAIPPELVSHQEHFTSYYGLKYQGRRLMWQYSLAHCILKAYFPKGKKELDVSMFQAVALQCFNERTSLTLPEIRERTKLEKEELRRTLQSLACGKIRVLSKTPKTREVADDDRFDFNEDFSQKLFRIKINSIQLKESAKENEKTHESVFRDRQYQIDAAVVRIMKARKTLSHNMLMSEVFSQLMFPASAPDVKKRLESLIERDYLERDEEEANTYRYLA